MDLLNSISTSRNMSELCHDTYAMLVHPSILLAFAILFISVYFYRSISIPAHYEPLAPNDLLWLYDSLDNALIISGMQVLDPMSLSDAKELILTRGIAKHPRLTKKIVHLHHRAYWTVDKSFSIDHHVVLADIGQNPEHPVTRSELLKYMGSIYNRPLNPEHPLFQCLLIQHYEGNKSVLFVRSHHVMGDGLGFSAMVMDLVDKDAIPAASHVPKLGGVKTTAATWLYKLLQVPFAWLSIALTFPDNTVLHGPSLSGERVVALSEGLQLKDVKFIKNALKCTVNDVIMACVAGAFRKYLLAHDGSPVKDVNITVPVSMRNAKQLQNIKLHNHVTTILAVLPCQIPDAMERLRETNRRMTQLKQSVYPLATYVGIQALNYTISWFARWCIYFTCNKSTAILTNVPGPTQPLKLYGRTVHDFYAFVPGMGKLGIGMAIFSYVDSVNLSLTADKALCDNPDELISYFQEEFMGYKRIATALTAT